MRRITITYKLFFSLGLLLIGISQATADTNDRTYIRRGNRLYRDTLYQKSEIEYRKAIEKKNSSSRAFYNLGNALLMQQKAQDAMKMYESAISFEKNKMCRAQMFHNMGVILQSQKQFAEAIECYKNALRNNSHDDQTRYNLVLCQRQLKNQPKDKKKEKEKQQKQNPNPKDKNKGKEKQQKSPQQQDKNQMSKDNAEQLLQAAQQEEKRTQEKVKKGLQQVSPRKLEKNW
ncbi:MAG: tetratricopeptide repeat protein [Bacteroidaceae bacterium]